MEKETPIIFDGQPHEWIMPALYPSVKEYRKSLEAPEYKDLNKEDLAKTFYERLALAKAIGETPNFLASGIPDNLLFDGEDNLDDALVRDANTFLDTNGVEIKSVDQLEKDQKNYLFARRMETLMSPSYDKLRDYLYSRYNPSGRAEEEKWKNSASIPPTPAQSTSPSRQHSLGMTGQQIDPRYPLFLQVPNPHIPWGMNHPLRVMYTNSLKSGGLPQETINDQLREMDSIAKGDFLLENYNPFWDANADKYPILNQHLRSIHERNNTARAFYPQFYQPDEYLPYFKDNGDMNPFEQKIANLFK